jgi:trans-2,3-dihydro-3-hydroxyanthranilate isomerase
MTRREYALLDVFTDRKFGGNQLAVFHDGAGVTDALMHAAAKELNLTEITFLVPAEHGGDHRIRIFSPTRELPFAGHPTIGTAFVLARGRDATLRLEEQVGTLQVTVRAASLGLDAADLEPALPIEIGSSGLRFMFVAVKTLDAVSRASPRELAEAAYVFTTDTVEPGSTVHGRMYGREIAEDPATGSANGPLWGVPRAARAVRRQAHRLRAGLRDGSPITLVRPSRGHSRSDHERARRRTLRDRRRRVARHVRVLIIIDVLSPPREEFS